MYFRPVFFTSSTILLAVRDAGGHRHGAGDVLAGLERGEAHPRVIGNRRVDVNEIHVLVLEQRVEILIANFDAK